jgi:hypothetical protein
VSFAVIYRRIVSNGQHDPRLDRPVVPNSQY